MGSALASVGHAWAQAVHVKDTVPVLYPDLGEPYRSAFLQILSGLEERLSGRLDRVPLSAQAEATPLVAEVARRKPRVVIALGRSALKSALQMDCEVVGGAIVSPGEDAPRIAALLTLAPDPRLLFQRLKTLAPTTRRITVVYSARASGWLIQAAKDAARLAELELRALEANDLREALRHYQDFFAQPSAGDSLWLPQDNATVDEAAVLPLVIRESWNLNIPVFSSSLVHVRRGVLFSLYPNNSELGRTLGVTALAVMTRSSPSKGPQTLRDVYAALNTRTARHLGIDLSPQLQSQYDLLLPER